MKPYTKLNRQAACSIPDCANRVLARTWCNLHYRRWLRHGDPLVILTPERVTGTDAERFYSKVEGPNETGCREWTDALTSDGYGRFSTSGKKVYAHRWAYEYRVGPIPEGLTLDHLCRNRACVTVSHLEPVTLGENILRGMSPMAQNARKTHCKYGHEFTPENTYAVRGGGRACRQCNREHSRVVRAGGSRPFDTENGEPHYCDPATLLARVPRTLLCICGAVVREHVDGHRDDAATAEPHVHRPPPQPEPLKQIEGPKQIEAPKPRLLPDRTGEMPA